MNMISTIGEPVECVSEAELYRRMADEYRDYCTTAPFNNRCLLAMKAGSKVLGITLDDLRARDSRKSSSSKRHMVMAFCRFMLLGRTLNGSPCGPTLIGRAFTRDHATVAHAWKKYGRSVTNALGDSP